jgi:hypothetical protein
MASYRITLTNLTHAQPLAPMAIILHGDAYMAWEAGEAASNALETLAESGSPAELIQAASQDADVIATASGTDVILPGAAESVDIQAETGKSLQLSVATMLVNTNDAFGGISAQPLSHLEVGQSTAIMAPAYDAGTEANTESAAGIPGPAGGGEGFNSDRDDVDFVHIHPGVISSQDGLDGSVLNGAHRWDNPVFQLVITRTG